MQQTEKYKFNLPNDTKDAFSTAPLNENMEKLDAELARMDADLGSYGANVRLATGTYVGTGTVGGSFYYATVLQLERLPEILFVFGGTGDYTATFIKGCMTGRVISYYQGAYTLSVKWGEDGTVSWCVNSQSAELQLNAKNATYTYVGLYAA